MGASERLGEAAGAARFPPPVLGIDDPEIRVARALLIPDEELTQAAANNLARSARDTYRTVRDEQSRLD